MWKGREEGANFTGNLQGEEIQTEVGRLDELWVNIARSINQSNPDSTVGQPRLSWIPYYPIGEL